MTSWGMADIGMLSVTRSFENLLFSLGVKLMIYYDDYDILLNYYYVRLLNYSWNTAVIFTLVAVV